jgi:hypothetical protein
MGVNIIDLSPPTLILPLRGGRRFFLTQLGSNQKYLKFLVRINPKFETLNKLKKEEVQNLKQPSNFHPKHSCPTRAPRNMKISTPTPPLPPQRGRVRVGGVFICVLKLKF